MREGMKSRGRLEGGGGREKGGKRIQISRIPAG